MSNNINVLKDMIGIRDGMKEYAYLCLNDINDIINKISLNWIETVLLYILYLLCFTEFIYPHSLTVYVHLAGKLNQPQTTALCVVW